MRKVTPLIKIKNKWVAYPDLTVDKAIIFGERQLKRNQTVVFETEYEQITLEQLKEVML